MFVLFAPFGLFALLCGLLLLKPLNVAHMEARAPPGVGHHPGITMKPPSRARAALVKPQVPPTQGNRTSCDQPSLPPPGASPGAGIPVRFYVCVRMYTCKSKAGSRPATHFHLSSLSNTICVLRLCTVINIGIILHKIS